MLNQRSQEKEWMDLGSDYYTHEEYTQCLKKLFWINKLLGFFRSTVKSLKSFSRDSTLLDIGCGGGLFILNLSKIFPQMTMLGIDISPEAIHDANHSLQNMQKTNPNIHVRFQLRQNQQLQLAPDSVDIILITLVCHHLADAELVVFLQQSYAAANKAVIINDLHRHSIAHCLYRLMSPFFRNRLISHDGLISIRRGFTRNEWLTLLQQAGIQHFKLKWCFPFRWQLILERA